MNRPEVLVELPPGRGPKQLPPPTPSAAPMIYVHERPEWEYKIVTRSSDELLNEQELNALGKEGWELSATTSLGNEVKLYFKRAK